MSTILDALKRLEEERRAANAPQALRSMTGGTPFPPFFNRRGTGLVLLVLVAVGVAAAFVWVKGGVSEKNLFRKSSYQEPTAVAAVPDAPSERRAVAIVATDHSGASADKASADQSMPSRGFAVKKLADRPAPALRSTVPPTYSNQLQLKPSPARPFSEASAEGMLSSTPVDPVAGKSSRTGSKPSGAGSAALQQPSRPDAFTNAESLPREILQLQAISWSDVPNSRITVIGGRILREGHSIDGYTVILIRPGDIILEKEGKRWKLAYSNP